MVEGRLTWKALSKVVPEDVCVSAEVVLRDATTGWTIEADASVFQPTILHPHLLLLG